MPIPIKYPGVDLSIPYQGGKGGSKCNFMESFYPESFESMTETYGGSFKNASHLSTNFPVNFFYNDHSFPIANLMKALQKPKKLIQSIGKLISQEDGLKPPVPLKPENKDVLDIHYGEIHKKWTEDFIISIQEKFELGKLNKVDWELAAKFAFCLKYSHDSIPFGSFQRGGDKDFFVKKIFSFVKHLDKNEKAIQKRMSRVEFFNQDAISFLLAHDSIQAFHLLDPPYFEREYLYDGTDFRPHTWIDLLRFVRLCYTVKRLQGKFMFCHYYHPLLERYFPRDQYQWIFKAYPKSEKKEAVEIIITNYQVNPDLVKNHLLEEARKKQPDYQGQGTRYSFEFKRNVLRMLESGLFTRKEIMELMNIGSYSTLKRWEKNKKVIFDSLYWIDKADKARSKGRAPMLRKALNILKNDLGMTLGEISERLGMSIYKIKKAMMTPIRGKRKTKKRNTKIANRKSIRNPKRKWISGENSVAQIPVLIIT